jgi:tetratricopeptide (TPR) repeat protein
LVYDIKSAESLEVFIAPLTIGLWLYILSYTSRRFELEADLAGARLIGDTERFVSALLKVSESVLLSKEIRSLRHFSIAYRVTFLRLCELSTEFCNKFESSIRRIKRLFIVLFVIGILCAGVDLAKEIRESSSQEKRYVAYQDMKNGKRILDSGRFKEAEVLFDNAIKNGLNIPIIYKYLGDAQYGQGLYKKALKNYRVALENGCLAPLDRIYLEEAVAGLLSSSR